MKGRVTYCYPQSKTDDTNCYQLDKIDDADCYQLDADLITIE